MRFYLLLLLAAIGCLHNAARTQVVNTMPAQQYESFFLYEVKLIDEFIERFDDDPESYVRRESRATLGTDSMVTRPRLIKSLFNRQQQWDSEVLNFINDACTAHPTLLAFTDSNWYAEAQCVFTQGKTNITIPVILHIRAAHGSARWMIAGIGKCTLPKSGKANTGKGSDFIPTSSHGTNFLVFHRVFAAGMNPANYFEPQLLATDRASRLIGATTTGQLKFGYVKAINYHFYQVPGWVFTVARFKRKHTNSGWLISGLQRANSQQKSVQLHDLLYP